MKALELKVPPPVVALLIAGAVWALAPLGPVGALPGRGWLALGLAALGGAFDLSALVVFVRRRTTVNPLRPANTSALVTSGVYRFTRNPMYLGLALLLGAWAVWLGAALALLGPVAFVAYINRFQIAPEERMLTTLFGDSYTAYTRQVRRWV